MRLNTAVISNPIHTHEGGIATHTDSLHELKRAALTCMLWENTFYEKGSEIATRMAALVPKVKPEHVAALACEARDQMNLRHVPLFLARELARHKGNGALVADTLEHVIQRADELSEFLAIYWREKREPLSAGVKRGLARAFRKFDAYKLAKYDRENKIKLRDALFLSHAKPKDDEQAALWKRLVDGSLEPPDTWEVELSAGKDKKETFERLMREAKLGGLALLRNLRGMLDAKVDEGTIRDRLSQGAARAFPYRFVVAAKHAPRLEDAIEVAMLKAVEGLELLPGKTGLLIDVSGSMDYRLGNQNESRSVFQSALMAKPEETSRIDVAAGVAILLREKAAGVRIATFSQAVVELPPRRGFALRDAIQQSQPHGGTYLKGALDALRSHWTGIDRLIVITDEQSQDGISEPWAPKSYVVNVAPNKNGVSYRNGWNHIDGWSERVIDYIREDESLEAVTSEPLQRPKGDG
jgi:60 kDa SS-A/Ro ribonucleoprotein